MSDPIGLIILAIIALLILSAFFSGSETALTAASRPRMHQLELGGNTRALVVNRLRRQQERLIGGILVGNNLVNILASALATSVLIKFFGDAGIAYATLGMTLLVLIFSEVLPKTYAIRNADKMALATAPLLQPVIAALSPVTRMIEIVVKGLLSLFGERDSEVSRAAREEEIRGAVGLHAGADDTAAHEGYMLFGVLDLDDVDVSEIMTHRTELEMINVEEPLEQIIAQVSNSPYSRIPLYRDDPDNVVGVVHAKALLRELQIQNGHAEQIELSAVVMEPWFVPESTDCLGQLHAFRSRKEHFALVVDEYGALQGVVTLEDIVEEIVGEIDDEHDVSVAGIDRQTDGSAIVEGHVTIRDLNREMNWALPDEEATTVAGLLMYSARLIPEQGQQFEFYGFRFEVLRREAQKITSLRIAPGE